MIYECEWNLFRSLIQTFSQGTVNRTQQIEEGFFGERKQTNIAKEKYWNTNRNMSEMVSRGFSKTQHVIFVVA